MHIAVFPWLAMGHLIPFLRLSKLLAGGGHTVSFISTPANLRRLSLLTSIPPGLTLVPLPIPSVLGLPRPAESSMDIPPSLSQFLKLAFDHLQPSLSSFLHSSHPHWIIHDYASHWLPAVAASHGVPSAFLSLFTAATAVFCTSPPGILDARVTAEDFVAQPEWVPFPTHVSLRLHEAVRILQSSGNNESGISDSRRFSETVAGSEILVVRSSPELEPEWFGLMQELYKKPVLALGLLPPLDEEDVDGGDGDGEWRAIEEFLDSHDPGTVVYAAMGSEVMLDEREEEELREGLELSGVGFFLVVRGVGVKPLEKVMAVGGRRGVVHIGWAPQTRILRHRAVGGFLTHCGWNSVVEGLAAGRVLILLPMINDQGLNSRVLAKKGAGVEVAREGKEGLFTRKGVAEAVKLAMLDGEGAAVRAMAKEMKTMFNDSDGVEALVHYLEKNKSQGVVT